MTLPCSQYIFMPSFLTSNFSCVWPFRILLIGILGWSAKSWSTERGPRTLGPSTTILSTGISSMVSSDDGMIVVGTKTGRLLVSHRTGNTEPQDAVWQELDREQYSPNYPIYSLVMGNDVVFAGAGDKYVSIWTQRGSRLHFQGRLGPHTGWVKDVTYCKTSKLLYSIGCNCVESWDVADTSATRHVSKRSIENSPDTGYTLSSDLLSLCLVPSQCLLSGGVDGRIHVWSLDPLDLEPVHSSRIHDGRVNAMVYSSEMNVLFSVGHDGRIVASRLRTDPRGLEAKTNHRVGEASSRLTRLCLVTECANGCRLVVGTTEGNVICIDVGADLDIKEYSTLSIVGAPMIYSVSTLSDQSTILVGHAQGLVAIQR